MCKIQNSSFTPYVDSSPWIKSSPHRWKTFIPLSEEAFQDERKTCLHFVASTDFFETLLNNYCSLKHLQRVISYVLRFVFNLKNPANKHSLSLSFFDLN
ncbi:hypothetical protein NQ318_000561 [Aromia moschata]|uniref:Maturase K n=1 Tax=Aromia moschata TaxID=1265417 RepID=A0AAV8XWM9_9CUCU|nr:hypothetical protein NQ318_000561 [Aromia moschata]